MKKQYLFPIILIGALVLAGCTKEKPSDTSVSPKTSGSVVEEKVGDTTKTGIISVAGERYFITEPGGSPKVLDSYAVDLSEYIGQTVTVTGQYSGDTLFVGEVN